MSKAMQLESIPSEWRVAYERDAAEVSTLPDPAPERRASRMLAAYVLSGLAFFVLPGTFLGVWNLLTIASHRSAGGANPAWIQAHGQAQLLGWVGSFILGISLYVLPKFRGRALKRFGLAWTVWALWTAGVFLRWWAGIAPEGWRIALIAGAVLEFAAYILFQYVVLFAGRAKQSEPARRKRPHDLGSWLGITGFLFLGVALFLNLWIALPLAWHGASALYPLRSDHALVVIEVWGFALPVAWGYSTRFVTIFLGLQPSSYRAWPWLCGGVAGIVGLALAQRFDLADGLAVAVAGLAIWALRIYRPAVKPAKRIGVYRGYPLFIRASYIWLAVGAVMGIVADFEPRWEGLDGASRHAITVGFIVTLIFALAPRILPAFLNGRELFSTRLMAASLWLLTVGCLARVSSEAVAYSTYGMAWKILPVSAYLEFSAVLLFSLNLVATALSQIPAWLAPEEVNADLPLYWYVTSFPKLRAVLARAGLSTLNRKREIPRSLSLGEAARADEADLGAVISNLRAFFARRQPRRR
jgi:uncharacterized protein involved in response to NO